MVNTLKKIVLGALLAGTVTLAVGAVDTFAADKWEKARQEMIDNYKADLEEKIAEEEAVRKAVYEEIDYRYDVQNRIKNDLTYSEVYVKTVAEQSRGLDRDAIKDAKEYAQSWNANAIYWYNFNMQHKNWDERNAARTEAVDEAAPKIKDDKDGNQEAVKRAYKFAFGKDWNGKNVEPAD